jgi:thioredoxin-like negative regulator of GroEL
MDIDWKSVEEHNGLVPREKIKEFLEEATGAEVIFLEPGVICMNDGNFIQETPYSSGNKITREEALIDALHALLEDRRGRNVIALRQATVYHQIGIRFYAANVLAAMYTKKPQE